jgi:4-amino-4-deoxy-L-arabinose transferase-like glycosyltransferase
MSEPGWFEQEKKRGWLLWAICVLPLLGFWLYGLTDMDEGFYGATAIDMMRRGDWITPTYNGIPWFEKPILLYWLAIPSIQLFGEFVGPRLPSVLAGIGLLWAVMSFTRIRLGSNAAAIATIVCSGSLLFIFLSRQMLTDSVLVLAFSGSLMFFWNSLESSGADRAKFRALSGLLLGLSILAKGPAFGAMFLLIIAFIAWRLPDHRPAFKGGWLGGILLGFAAIAAWYVPAYMANGSVFVDEFLIKQNIGRFKGGDKAHATPSWMIPIYFPIVLGISLMPWLPAAWKNGLFKRGEPDPFRTFLWIWVGVVFAIFSISSTKLPHYIFPTIPPLAMLCAGPLTKRFGENMPRFTQWAAVWSVFALLLINGVMLSMDQNDGKQVHALVRNLRARSEDLVVYGIGGGKDKAQMTTELLETSKPSIIYYWQRPLQMTGSVASAVENRSEPFILVTKSGRFDPEEASALGWFAHEMEESQTSDQWEAWLVSP